MIIGESAAEFYIPHFVERTLVGALPIGLGLALFFGLRMLAHKGLRRIGLVGFVWLDVAIGLFVVMLWSAGVGIILDEGGAEFNLLFVKRTLVGAMILGGALALFFGLRALARMRLRRVDQN